MIAEHGGVDVLVNNAGVALGGTFLEVAESDFDWLFGINFWGVVRMTRAFLPHLQKSEEARLVNMSSLFGLIAPPGQTAYAASKFAVRGFSESAAARACRHAHRRYRRASRRHRHLDCKERADAGQPLRRSGCQAAEIFRFSSSRMPPEIAGETIVRGVEHRRPRILIGSDCQICRIGRTAAAGEILELSGAGAKK